MLQKNIKLHLIWFVFALGCISQLQGQTEKYYSKICGFVADSSKMPIPEVSIYLINGTLLAQTDEQGYFEILLADNNYKIVFAHKQYETFTIEIHISGKNDTFNILMNRKVGTESHVEIFKKRKDPGPEMMRKAIAKREYYAKKRAAYSAELYIKAVEEFQKAKKVKSIWRDSAEDDTSKLKEEYLPVTAIAEIIMQQDFQPQNKIKETRSGFRKNGSIEYLFYLSGTEGDFNFYQNLIPLPNLGTTPVLSPLASTALLAYRFSFLGSYKNQLGQRILKIKMKPMAHSNATFSGEIHLIDSLFMLYRIEAQFPKACLNSYDNFVIHEELATNENGEWYFKKLYFDYFAKAGKDKFSGNTKVITKNIVFNPKFPKNHFGNELAATTDSAYLRDSAYWASQRAAPLEKYELRFISKSDSIKRIQSSDAYLDSMEKIGNKVSFKSLFLTGQDYANRKKGISMGFQPLWLLYQPWWPGGGRLVFWNSINKEFKNKKTISFNQNLSYGLLNKDVNGNIFIGHTYNPFRRGYVQVQVSRDFDFVNPNASLTGIFRRENFFRHDRVELFHRIEVVNGLFFSSNFEYGNRYSISNYKFSSQGDSLFANNNPLAFKPSTNVGIRFGLSYTPFQKYIREPKQKIILGSMWPTFSINYRQSIPNIFNSNTDFSYLEYRIDHDFLIGSLGLSELRVNSGAFLRTNKMRPMDYRYHRGGDPLILTPPLFNFQTLDTTFITFKRFYELHYRHDFNGWFLNKLIIFKPLKLREQVGMNILYAPERSNMFFIEFYAGIDKVVRVFREKMKFGIYYAWGHSNLYEKPIHGIKINIQYFDRSRNRWL